MAGGGRRLRARRGPLRRRPTRAAPLSSSDARIAGSDIRAALGRPELRAGFAAETALVVLLTGGWWTVRGADDPELDRAGLFAGMALSVVALAGAVAAAWRGGPHDDAPARVLRSGYHLFAAAGELASALVTAVGLGLGSDIALRARDIASFFLVLLGLLGETTSAAWMWTARVAALVCAAALIVLVRAVRRHGVRGEERG